MQHPTVAWTEPYRSKPVGNDHLGMRVAGEGAYQRLFDFTTTVSFRPRYYTFLCWSLEQAFALAGGRRGDEEHEIDARRWRQCIKRQDYAIVAASILGRSSVFSVAGSNEVSKKIGSAGATLVIADDHLRASLGSFAIYAGPMRQLGLIDTASAIDRPSPKGQLLASAFERSLLASSHETEFRDIVVRSPSSLPRSVLRKIGQYCGVNALADGSQKYPVVAEERDVLRACIIDWNGFKSSAAVRRRMLSIGIVLEFFRLSKGTEIDLDDFRGGTLLDGLIRGGKVRWLKLPHHYDDVQAAWRVYQAHAYATYSLEILLGLVVREARRLSLDYGGSAPIDEVVRTVGGQLESGKGRQPKGLEEWWRLPRSKLDKRLRELVGERREAPFAEPELLAEGRESYDDNEPTGRVASAAALLFCLSAMRLRLLLADSPGSWIGDEDAARLPPKRLIEWFDENDGLAGEALVFRLLGELVIQQHRKNVLRKLAADPLRETGRFDVDGSHMAPLITEEFDPGTSNPRFSNVRTYLMDLGYLTDDGDLTTDGEELRSMLERGSQ
jgi:hypothetical protein